MKKILILAATIAAALSVGVATSAATPTTPGGYCGALNMVHAWPGGGANVPGKLVRFPRPGVTGGHPVPVSFTL